jgi:hypothetical protein
MSKLLACLLGMFGSLYASQAPATSGKPEDEKCSIEGRVVNSVTGEPVRRAVLMLGTGDANSINIMRSAESDDKGQFAFRNVNPGRYILRAERTGFAALAYGAKPISRTPTLLVLSAGQQVKGLLFKLVPNAPLSGRVLDSEGEPIEGVTVTALRSGYERGERHWFSRGSALTNDLGEFRIASLEAGNYIVAAAPGFTLKGELETSDKPEMGHVTTYYAGATEAEGATPVRVEAGGETRVADIRMLRVPMVRVSGKLAGDWEGKQVRLRLVPKGGGPPEMLAEKTANVQLAGGSFELKGVASGSYLLSAMSSDFLTLLGAQPVQVGDQNIEGLLLQVRPGSELSGVLTVEGRSSPNLEKVGVFLRPRGSVVSSVLGGYADERGKFTLKGLSADRYLVEVREVNYGPERFYVKSVRFGGQDVTEEGLDLTGGATGSLQITLSLEVAQVDGVVQDSDSKPVSGATVVLVPDSRRYSLYKQEQTDQYGAFSLKGITPGNYKLLAWEDIEAGAYQDPEFLKKYESKAESLSLKPNDRRIVQVKVIPFENSP